MLWAGIVPSQESGNSRNPEGLQSSATRGQAGGLPAQPSHAGHCSRARPLKPTAVTPLATQDLELGGLPHH